MSDDKKDDFWSSSLNDDFWKTDSSADYSGLSKEFFEDEKPRQDPYFERETEKQENLQYRTSSEEFRTENPYVNSHVHHDSGWVMEQHEREEKTVSLNGEKKRIHVRTIICLIAMLTAVLSIVTAVIFTKMAKQRVHASAMDLDYEQKTVSDTFRMYENNRVSIDDQAYTIVTKESFRGFPEDLKLIAVYVEVESEKYLKDSYAMRDIYIGFEEDGEEAYKKPARKDLVSPYICGYGFKDDQILSTYGIGNGIDYSGYYFFFVPANADGITLYMEQKKDSDGIPVIDTLYKMEMTVLPEDEGLTEELAEREVF